ncbi:DJ-1/PfpI family protein [Pseudonocardia kujensis]|uniref:DJ-1/PfpI family protein n=1 Tax=Pseudonocardia kujensis TaxID=1128675 RepID=UPI001E46266D|nr:DJ-1/PfpI family protein [Pseudonocardia kujensis]MCE0767286.1 DJ-1/PfpI family protein [Pseudonocardia kujensis]
MQVAIPLFPRLTALDAIGPYDALQHVPELEVVFVGAERDEVRTENGMLGLTADATFAEVPDPAVVVVPGGIGSRDHLGGSPLVDWVRAVHPGTRATTSVCTGSLILGAAGLLTGLPATTHWGAVDVLARFGAQPVRQRVVELPEQRIITAAGVSSGIDMAIRLVARLVDEVAAQAAQVSVEYDPEPPYEAGHPDQVGEGVMARLAEYRAARS